MADWSLLPSDLIDRVAGFLSQSDQARMAAACKPWRDAIADGLCRRQRPRSIWIILGMADARRAPKGTCQVASFSEGMRSNYFPMPTPAEKVQVFGSCGGWIILEDESARLHAFNPIARTAISFPRAGIPISKIVFLPQRRAHRRGDERPPVAAIFQKSIFHLEPQAELSFSCVGDDVWTPLPVPANVHFEDIAVHQGKLYALGITNQILIFDMDGENLSSSPPEIVIPSAMPMTARRYFDPDFFVMRHQYIGLILDEIVLVRCWFGTPWRHCPESVPQFEVVRLKKGDESGWKWAATRDLAGHAILHDMNGFIALHGEDHPELRANCIYFTRRCIGGDISLTVTNLENETASEIPQSFHSYSVPRWFLPSS